MFPALREIQFRFGRWPTTEYGLLGHIILISLTFV